MKNMRAKEDIHFGRFKACKIRIFILLPNPPKATNL